MGGVKTFSNQVFHTGTFSAIAGADGIVSFSVYDSAASITFILPPKVDGSGQVNLLNPGSQDSLQINGSSNFKLAPNISGNNSWSKGYQQNYALNYVGFESSDGGVMVTAGQLNLLKAEAPIQDKTINELGVEVSCINYDDEDNCRLSQ